MEVLGMNRAYSYANHLVHEKSPYLLQHAHDPVDWYPWGREAFEKAKLEDKPIFLSIGYSTCHWCHVMHEESFLNQEIAALLNQYFVAIKVDREERPDIDSLYMKAVLAMTGSGGWPLTIFLTPDKKPFFGGTYFPPEDRWGKPGLKTILVLIKDNWERNRERLLSTASSITEAIRKEVNKAYPFKLEGKLFGKTYLYFKKNFDQNYGGFGDAPKFPTPHNFGFLLRYYNRIKDKNAIKMVEKSLKSMAKGGIYDHIGGGFHRYSTDKRWLLPHFEKMLYDQALISRIYLETYQLKGNMEYADIAKGTLDYVLRDMQDKKGGFYTAEDADSPSIDDPTKKKEGEFYLWDKAEILSLLGKEKGELFSYYFGIKEGGNLTSDSSGELKGKNILYISHDVNNTAKHFSKTPEDIESIIKQGEKILFKRRNQRPRPPLDDKILTDWNGLMIATFSFAFRVFGILSYKKGAERAARFILRELKSKDGKLLHRYIDGEGAINGMLDDYAFFILGLLELYQTTFNPYYLKEAKTLTDKMIELFWDEENGGFFLTSKDSEDLIGRQKLIYDGAIPSGNSVAILDIILLYKYTLDKEYKGKIDNFLKAFGKKVSGHPYLYTQMLIAFDFLLGPSQEIVIAQGKEGPKPEEMIEIIEHQFIPNKILILIPSEKHKKEELFKLIPFINNQIPMGGKTTAYICRNYECKLPTSDIETLMKLLE
jgi:hypothetical protein